MCCSEICHVLCSARALSGTICIGESKIDKVIGNIVSKMYVI